MEQYVERAIAAGIGEMGFSDHLYLYWLPREQRDPELGMADWELDAYVEDVERCRARYARDISIRLSTEADYVPGHVDALGSILSRYDWDYVVGSVHFVDGWGMDDSRYLDGYDRWDIDALYAHYFDLVGESAETGLFDVIGHPDLVKKFGHRPRQDQAEAYRQLAQRFAAAGVCVEVNSAGLRKPVGELYPHQELLRACRAAAVPATLGSDAHAPMDVAAGFEQAVEALRAAGYTHFSTFRGRRRVEEPLPARGDVGAAASTLA